MKAQKILAQVRLYVGDAAKAKFADWQVVRAANDALRVMAEENAKSAGLLFRRSADVVLEAESGVLPSDFLNVIRGFAEGRELLQVHGDSPGAGEYAIRGDVLCSGEPQVTLWYFAQPPEVTDGESEIEVPERYATAIARAAAALLAGGEGGAVSVVDYFLPNMRPAAPQRKEAQS